MNKSIVQTFCYDLTDVSVMAQAEDRAKEKGLSFSKYIVELIKKDLEEQKNLIALDKSAISGWIMNQSNNQNNSISTLTLNQNTLDIYLSTKSEINTHINQVQDLGRLRDIRDKSKMIMNVSQTRINNLVVKVA